MARRDDATDTVVTWLPYDVLAPESLNYAYVLLNPPAFARLWQYCDEEGLRVVGDVHTHPGGPRQSPSDRAHPMISLAGHVAIIVPWFARRDPKPVDVSFNVYLGAARWKSFYGAQAATRIMLN